VDAFHAAGLAVGGRDNGAPGLRAHYHPDYYGAFIDDPSGHHLEAVIHTPPGRAKPKAHAQRKGAKATRAAKAVKARPAKAKARKPAGRKPARR